MHFLKKQFRSYIKQALSSLWPPILLVLSLQTIPVLVCVYKFHTPNILDQSSAGLLCMLVPVFLSMLPPAHSSMRRACLTVTCFAYVLAGAVQSIHLILYGTPLILSSIAAIEGTNFSESIDFILHFLNFNTIFIIIACFAIPLLPLMGCIRSNQGRKTIAASLALLLVIMFIRSPERFWKKDPIFDIYSIYAAYKEKGRELSDIPVVTPGLARQYSLSIDQDIPFTLVILIGESANRGHQQLYGYTRKTNPLMSARKKDLLIFTDMISPHFFTQDSHRCMLLAPVSNMHHGLPLIDTLNFLGVDTWWVTTQETYNKHYAPMFLRARHLKTLSAHGHGYSFMKDGALLEEFPRILASSLDKTRRVIFLNINGSHLRYRARYPEEFEILKGRQGMTSPFAGDNMAMDTINAYDNSILYTDFILDALVKELERNGGSNSALLYLSDHGQDVYDIHDHATHCPSSQAGADIPFWIWMSPSFQKWHQNDLPAWRKAMNRPAMADSLTFIIADLLHISLNDINRGFSPLSMDYAPRHRMPGGTDYDLLAKQSSKTYPPQRDWRESCGHAASLP